jgi:cation diffusion facilitator family transporter
MTSIFNGQPHTDRKHHKYGLDYAVVVALWDGPRTTAQIHEDFSAYLRRLGMFDWQIGLHAAHQSDLEQGLTSLIAEIRQRGWIRVTGDRYELTELGRTEAGEMIRELRLMRAMVDILLKPGNVSKVSLLVYLLLTLVKLPAGILAGSVGLINDSIDTLLDGLCSALVYLGFHFQRERLVNVVQVIMLTLTGCLAVIQAVSNLIRPHELDADVWTFLAAGLSAVVCAGLFFYQRYAGLRNGSLALITQSVDSRNHVIVGASVTVGLIASVIHFSLLDTIVGLVVAILILKSGIELAIELARAMTEEQVDLSRYQLTSQPIEHFQQEQLCDWMLYLIQEHHVANCAQLISQARNTMEFANQPMLRELGLDHIADVDRKIERAVAVLTERQWVNLEPSLSLTPDGEVHLCQRMQRFPRHRIQWRLRR